VTLTIRAVAVPLFAGVLDIVNRNRSGGMASNQEHFASRVTVGAHVGDTLVDLLYDPQTSGGLLVAVAEQDAQALVGALLAAGVPAAHVGQADSAGEMRVVIR
jgi:selenide,water dikinase